MARELINIEIRGLNAVTDKLRKLGQDGEKAVKEVLKITAQDIADNAKTKAPKKDGDLFRSIYNRPVPGTDNNVYRVGAGMYYAPYQEFGTGSRVIIPEGFESLASQFKGKGLRDGRIRGKLFLYSSWVTGISKFKKDVEFVLKRLTNDFN